MCLVSSLMEIFLKKIYSYHIRYYPIQVRILEHYKILVIFRKSKKITDQSVSLLVLSATVKGSMADSPTYGTPVHRSALLVNLQIIKLILRWKNLQQLKKWRWPLPVRN